VLTPKKQSPGALGIMSFGLTAAMTMPGIGAAMTNEIPVTRSAKSDKDMLVRIFASKDLML
jgi:hypothetical protein